MTDEPKTESLSFPAESGFEQEPEPAAPMANGHAPEEPALDQLQAIVSNEGFPLPLRIIAERLQRAENAYNGLARTINERPDEFMVAEALTQFRAELQSQTQVVNQLGQIVARMSQQQAMQEFLAERQARSVALDLAIKALPEADRTGASAPATIVTYAEAFLGWLKGAQA